MFAAKSLRVYGVTWCQLKGVFKQRASLQTGQSQRASIAIGRWLSSQAPSDDVDYKYNPAAEPAVPAEPAAQHSGSLQKGIGRTFDEQYLKYLLTPDQPKDSRLLKVAIIGLPNSGKSTLTNSLMGWRVSSVSQKVHTTRKNTTGIVTEDNTQIVFLDTPGILHPASRKRHNLEKSMLIDPERSLHNADLVCVVVDVSNRWLRNEIDPLILQVLHLHRDTPAVLILNKVDLLQSKPMLLQMARSLTCGVVDGVPVGVSTKKTSAPDLQLHTLFDAMATSKETSQINRTSEETQNHIQEEPASPPPSSSSSPSPSPLPSSSSSSPSSSSPSSSSSEEDSWSAYFEQMRGASRAVQGMKGWAHFKRVFMVSALSGNGVEDVKDHLVQRAAPGDWLYHSSMVTAQDPRDLVLMCVREKLLEHLKQEMPYQMTTDIAMWEVDEDGLLNVIINVNTQNRRQLSFFLGPRGRTIQKIASEAKQEMMNAFRCEMRLKLIAGVSRRSRR